MLRTEKRRVDAELGSKVRSLLRTVPVLNQEVEKPSVDADGHCHKAGRLRGEASVSNLGRLVLTLLLTFIMMVLLGVE